TARTVSPTTIQVPIGTSPSSLASLPANIARRIQCESNSLSEAAVMMETKASNNGKFNYRCRAQTLSSECFYALAIGLKEVDQVIVWDRGRPARPDQATL